MLYYLGFRGNKSRTDITHTAMYFKNIGGTAVNFTVAVTSSPKLGMNSYLMLSAIVVMPGLTNVIRHATGF